MIGIEAVARGLEIMPKTTIAIFLAMFALVGYIVIDTSNELERKDEAYRSYMRVCIERYTAQRCGEFWRYDRSDLGLR